LVPADGPACAIKVGMLALIRVTDARGGQSPPVIKSMEEQP
jgi:hypothetical protein